MRTRSPPTTWHRARSKGGLSRGVPRVMRQRVQKRESHKHANRLQYRGRHIHGVQHRGHGPRNESARRAENPAERPCRWADPRLGLGGRTGAGLAHWQPHSTDGSARGRIASDQPGADRAVLPADGLKGAWRHVLRRRVHAADHHRHRAVAAVAGAAVDQGPDGGRLVAGETDARPGAIAAADRRRNPGVRPECSAKNSSRWSRRSAGSSC